jgi:hypothetical protein
MEDCAICFETLEENIINKWSCNHKFHSNCIKQWKKNSCPLCRTTKLNNEYKLNIKIIKSNKTNLSLINPEPYLYPAEILPWVIPTPNWS